MNRLSQSSSLYLQQHKDNPVDWHPWDETALTLARETARPILLSIGYSACHWCHVMAHESFEDQDTAELMNRLYVNIKLDREERPDLDKLYQLSHQLLSNRGGGWPLTVFLDPVDLTPFFAGTYFPPGPRHGLPAFKDLLVKIRQWFDENQDAVQAQNQRLGDAINQLQQSTLFDGPFDKEIFGLAFDQLNNRYDSRHGGFGGAPKFPQAPMLALLASLSQMPEDFAKPAAQILHTTLDKMARSGLRDHLDGGFFRYTVDDSWTIPHFEKMLYDNALLLPLYAEAAKKTGNELLRETTEGIADWLLTEMRSEEGGFYASIDADADGVEGGFHVWQPEQLKKLLNEAELDLVTEQLGFNGPANFEGEFWHLVRNLSEYDFDNPVLNSARTKMLHERSKRIPPGTDTKQLTSWNALCIEGFARAGIALAREDWVDVAEANQDFLMSKLWKGDQLFAVYSDHEARFPAYLDDHANLLKASMAMLSARWNTDVLSFAVRLADTMISGFEDSDSGGFYFSAKDQPAPISRLRSLQDDATPGGNGIASMALETLGHLTADEKYLDSAARALKCSYTEQSAHPLAHASLLCSLDHHLRPVTQIILTGSDTEELKAWKAIINRIDRVNCYVLADGSGSLPPIVNPQKSDERTTAYICEGLRCLPPVISTGDLKKQLELIE